MQEKAKTSKNKIISFLYSLRDIRRLGLTVFIGILLLMTWSGMKVVETNYGLQKQINELQQQADLTKLQNDTLRLGNQYYTTDTYLEQSARQNLGLAKPGETEVIIPKDVALSKLAKVSSDSELAPRETTQSTSNFRSWMNFFFHRKQVLDTPGH